VSQKPNHATFNVPSAREGGKKIIAIATASGSAPANM
jgi:hypothetical protein